MPPKKHDYLYLPLDVEFMENDRIADAGEKAAWLYLGMCLRSKRLLSDGKLSRRQIERLPITGVAARLAALMKHGLVEQQGEQYVIVGWTERNSTAQELQAKAELRAAVAKWSNHRRWHIDREQPEPACDYCSGLLPDVKPGSVDRSGTDRVPDTSTDRSPDQDTDRVSLLKTETETETETETVTTDSVPESKSAARRRPKKPQTDAPDIFPITPQMRSWGETNAPLITDPAGQTSQFLDYHRSKGNQFSDWTAAWRTWMKNAQTYAARDQRLGTRSGPPPGMAVKDEWQYWVNH